LATLVDLDNLVSSKQLAARWGRSVDTIRLWQRKGTGPKPIRIGWHLWYELAEVERYEREHGRPK
jgi:DNA-binding transcriptional MerR regulator